MDIASIEVTRMDKQQVLEWVLSWVEEHSDQENPDDFLDERMLRIGAVSLLQFARDSGQIDMEDYKMLLGPVIGAVGSL